MERVEQITSFVLKESRSGRSEGCWSSCANESHFDVPELFNGVGREEHVVVIVRQVAAYYIGFKFTHQVFHLRNTIVELVVTDNDCVVSDSIHDGDDTLAGGDTSHSSALYEVSGTNNSYIRGLRLHLVFECTEFGVTINGTVNVVLEQDDNVFVWCFRCTACTHQKCC